MNWDSWDTSFSFTTTWGALKWLDMISNSGSYCFKGQSVAVGLPTYKPTCHIIMYSESCIVIEKIVEQLKRD